ncbi:MAG TPA: excinuclease ABC subunit UvrC, partial [Usitatibacter sp.]|nr:excinuclease ABC subunit UvrC [Usitatibacter sp.]
MFDSAELIAGLPNLPGVYRFKNAAGDVIYVGKAGDLKKRVASYFKKNLASPRTAMMVSQIAGAETTVMRTEAEALLVENNLIKSLSPRYNVLFRDDKSYGYILITGHTYPQIRFYRGAHHKGNQYFGPFPSAWSVRETIGHLQKIFLLRTCDDTVFSHRSRPCLLYQIQRCSGPCVSLVSEADYAHEVGHAAKFLEGKESDVIEELTAKMNAASLSLDYEGAGRYRDQIRMLQRILSGQAAETTTAGDVDIVAVVERENVWCVTLAMVRGGRHLGDRSFFPQNASGSDAATVVEAFLTQHYAQQPAPGRVIAEPVENPAELEALLTGLAGRAVKLVTRPIGEARTWLEMAARNASL